jgi:hypothetical protein
MTAGILAILGPIAAALAPVFAKWVLRRWAAKDDPRNQLRVQKDENAQAILKTDTDDLNRLLDDRINRVQPGPTQGPGPVSR